MAHVYHIDRRAAEEEKRLARAEADDAVAQEALAHMMQPAR